jgi:hypothetical protein
MISKRRSTSLARGLSASPGAFDRVQPLPGSQLHVDNLVERATLPTMTKGAAAIAEQYGRTLPKYESAVVARRAMFAERDAALAHLASLDGAIAGFSCDRSIESLRALEAFYFALHARGAAAFARAGTTRKRFEDAMAMYVGSVATKHVRGARWIIEAYAFVPGGYEIGIAVAANRIMIGGMCGDFHKTPPNKRRDALYRQFRDFFGANLPRERARQKAKPSAPEKPPSDDAALAQEIERLLRRKSEPELLGGTLVDYVRYNLKDDRITARRILARAEALVRRGLLEKVPCKRREGFRYRIR